MLSQHLIVGERKFARQKPCPSPKSSGEELANHKGGRQLFDNYSLST